MDNLNKSEYLAAISQHLTSLGITQAEFARTIGESRQLVNMAFRHGHASLKLIDKITSAVGGFSYEHDFKGKQDEP